MFISFPLKKFPIKKFLHILNIYKLSLIFGSNKFPYRNVWSLFCIYLFSELINIVSINFFIIIFLCQYNTNIIKKIVNQRLTKVSS